MKVVHCSTSVNNTSANTRIHKALLKRGIDSWILTMYGNTSGVPNILEVTKYGVKYYILRRLLYYANIIEFFFLDRICKLRHGMPYTWATWGINICKTPIIKNADIIHIHCINSEYMSLKNIEDIILLGKPVVITLHDSWFLTGGCHVLDGCENYMTGCKSCGEIKRCRRITRRCYRKKRNMLKKRNVYYTAPSQWTYNNYLRSGLAREKCVIIGNTLNYDIFKPSSQREQRNGSIRLLFGAVNSTETPYKGFAYLIDMLKLFHDMKPDLTQRIELHIFGAYGSEEDILKEYNCKFEGYIKNEKEMARLYDMSDIYIVPSLEDSFNQTVLESCACETPVVSFKTGGICDIIKHKQTGYLAEYKNARDLMQGVEWILSNNKDNCIGKAARNDVKVRFSEEQIASRYIEVYNDILNGYKDVGESP